jgi:hypothetical protein
MVVKKGGISRQIDEKQLAKYKEKGYSEVEEKAAAAAPKAGAKNGSSGK